MARDLCDLVQELRWLNWSVALARFGKLAQAWPEHDDLAAIEALVAELRALKHPDADELADRYDRIAAELNAGPSIPRQEEIVARFSRGEIGDRTVMAVLGIDHNGLNELCRRYGAAPVSGARKRPRSTDVVVFRNREVMAGRAVFRGTRVPVEDLFENLADGLSLREILDAYETLDRADCETALAQACAALIAAAPDMSDRTP